MKIIKPLQLGFIQQVLEQNRQFHFIASVTLGVNLSSGKALLEFDFLKDAFACMGENPLPDMGMPKPCGEFLVSGSFFSPDKQEVRGGEVKVRLGDREKKIHIVGPRKWTNGLASSPQPFVSMPIDYSHAFGGEGFDANPAGIGYKDGLLPCIEQPGHLVGSPNDRPTPIGFGPIDMSLPQRTVYQGTYDSKYMENYFPGYPADFDYRFFLSAPRDQWRKEYFQGNEEFAIYHMHPELAVIRGRFPGLIGRCFLRHTFKSVEPIFSELPLNLDTIWFFPEKELALLIWRGATVVADDEAGQISQVLLAYEDRTDTPRSHEHYSQALDRRLASDDPLLNNFNTEDLIPLGHKCAMELLQEMALADGQESAFGNNLDAKVETITKLADEKIEEAIQQSEKQLAAIAVPDNAKEHIPDAAKSHMPGDGLDIRKMILGSAAVPVDADLQLMTSKLEAILPGITSADPTKIELKKFSFDKIDQLLGTVEEFSEKKERDAKEIMAQEIAKVKEKLPEQIEQIRVQIAKANEGSVKIPAEAEEKLAESLNALEQLENLDLDRKHTVALPRINAEETIAQLATANDQISPQMMEAMQHLQAIKKCGIEDERTANLEQEIKEAMDTANAQVEEGISRTEDALRQAEKDFKETYIMAAHFMEDGLSPHNEPEDVVVQKMLDDIAGGRRVADGDWACLDLSGRNLDRVDLSGAFLEQVNLNKASLKGANLKGAILARATLTNADFTGADLRGANIGGVQAQGAIFTDADLTAARLSKGDFTDADFTRCQLQEIESLEIVVNGAQFREATMPKVNFIESQLNNAGFSKADLSSAVFYDCTITDGDFVGAFMPCCTFADVRLASVCFDGADLSGSCFVASEPDKSTMAELRFVGACLDKCNFQGLFMQGAVMANASMQNANFNAVDLSGADLSRAQARGALFSKARFTNSRLDHINLMEGSLAKAHIVKASLVKANLYGVDFLRATIVDSNFLDANLDLTLIEGWEA